MQTPGTTPAERAAFVAELGMLHEQRGETLVGDAVVVPELCVPGTDCMRTSVLFTWADVLTGLLAVSHIVPRIPVTLDLDVHVERPPRAGEEIRGASSIVKAGRNVVVCEVRFTTDAGHDPVAVAHATFTASGDPADRFSEPLRPLEQVRLRLPEPLAARVGCELVAPRTAEVPRSPQGLNAAGNIQGGLIALAAEEAARNGRPAVATALSVRYLKPFTTGPARAHATGAGSLRLVRVVDAGRDDRLGAVVTIRQRPLAGG